MELACPRLHGEIQKGLRKNMHQSREGVGVSWGRAKQEQRCGHVLSGHQPYSPVCCQLPPGNAGHPLCCLKPTEEEDKPLSMTSEPPNAPCQAYFPVMCPLTHTSHLNVTAPRLCQRIGGHTVSPAPGLLNSKWPFYLGSLETRHQVVLSFLIFRQEPGEERA